MEGEGRISIHVDLVIEILSRLPVKTLLRLKCLSKEYSRIMKSQNFVDSCLSLSRPRLLFYFYTPDVKKLVFFSAPHRSTCSISPTRYEMTVWGEVRASVTCPPVRGLIFYTIGPNQHVICNPATRHHLSLPENENLGKRDDLVEFLIFGYDPISDKFKVLCISGPQNQYQFWVLTVGQDGNLWRKIQGMPNHLHPSKCKSGYGHSGICINGILYFKAYCHIPGHRGHTTHVVCFDLNSEKFSLATTNSHLTWFSKLIDLQGKLGFISRVNNCEIEFSCLMENKEWSSTVFHIPRGQGQYYPNHYATLATSVLGICDGEIVFQPYSNFGFTLHLSLEKKTTRKVYFEIPQIPEVPTNGSPSRVCYFANHADTNFSL